jgi:transcriptional regulator with XRE-family HTH domain
MVTRVGPVRRAIRIAQEDEARLRAELQRGRQQASLSREAVARAIGLPRTLVERIENGTRPTRLAEYAAFGEVLGLDVRLRAYPGGDPLRDIAHARLLERLRVRLHPSLRWATEVPLPIEGDLRAWDAVIRGPGWQVAAEAETVLADIQAAERKIALKQRDGGIDHVILLVADTRRNRRALAAAPASFQGWSRDSRSAMRALKAADEPPDSVIIIL